MSNKTQLSNNNDKLASLIQELANKAAGGGSNGDSGSIETGTLTGVTTLAPAPDSVTYYYDLENIPNFASKLLIVLTALSTSNYRNVYFILTRESLADDFEISDWYSGGTWCSGVSLDGNVFSIIDDSQVFAECNYYAAGGSSASGGAAVETCTVTITYAGPPLPNTEGKIYYTDSSCTTNEVLYAWGDTFEVIKGSVVVCGGDYSFPISSGTNYTYLKSVDGAAGKVVIYTVTGDVTFNVA